MKFTPRTLFVLFVAIFALHTGTAHALPILDFEGVTPNGTRTLSNVTPYVEDGFTLVSSGNPAAFHNDIFNNAASFNGNGNTTSIFGWNGSNLAVFTLTGPGPFSLLSIDFGGLSTGLNPGLVDVTGFFSGGGSILQTVDPGAAFSTTLFAGFTNLSSVTIGLRAGSFDPAMDNIVLDAAVAVVPEPGMLALFGLGALGFGWSRRRKS